MSDSDESGDEQRRLKSSDDSASDSEPEVNNRQDSASRYIIFKRNI